MKSIISGAIVATVVLLLAMNVNAKSLDHFPATRTAAMTDTGKMSKMSKTSKMSKMSKKDTGKMSKMSKMDKKKSKMAKKDTTGKM